MDPQNEAQYLVNQRRMAALSMSLDFIKATQGDPATIIAYANAFDTFLGAGVAPFESKEETLPEGTVLEVDFGRNSNENEVTSDEDTSGA